MLFWVCPACCGKYETHVCFKHTVYTFAFVNLSLSVSVRQRLTRALPLRVVLSCRLINRLRDTITTFLEANGRGYWETSEENIELLQDLYQEVEDKIEGV